MLGQFVGKALLDSRIIDVSFNPLFLKYILNEEVPLTLSSLKVSYSLHYQPDYGTNDVVPRWSTQRLPTRSPSSKLTE